MGAYLIMNKKKRKRGRPLGSTNSDKRINELKFIEPEKAKLISIIYKLQPEYKVLNINLKKYTIEQLQKHIDFVKKKRNK